MHFIFSSIKHMLKRSFTELLLWLLTENLLLKTYLLVVLFFFNFPNICKYYEIIRDYEGGIIYIFRLKAK